MTAAKIKAKVIVRLLTVDDIAAIRWIHRASFPGMAPWTEAQLRSQIELFPEGQIGVEVDGKLVATSSSLIVEGAVARRPHRFDAICDHGLIRNHDDDGDVLYGIDIAVHPEFRGLRLARRLYEARKELVRKRALHSFLIAGRMPRYHKVAKKLTPDQYVRQVLARDLKDPVVTAQVANGFVILAVLRDYMPSDRESGGHAVLMEWRNPDVAPEDGYVIGGMMRVASVQYQMRPVERFEDFGRQVAFFVDTASDYRCDFVLFPELLTSQLLSLVPADSPAAAARRLTEFTEPMIELFRDLAVRYHVNVIGGTHLTVENGQLLNIAWLFRRDGSVDRQVKIHITPSEARWWGVASGEEVAVFDTDRGKIAILICYDIEFPELARIATSKGARVLFVPYNTDIRPAHLRVRTCAAARAIENHVYVVTAGAVGNLPQVEGADIHYGQSAILTPSDIQFSRDGIAAEATPNVETMLVHDLDLELLRRTRRSASVRPWVDRRRELYSVRYREGGEDRDA